MANAARIPSADQIRYGLLSSPILGILQSEVLT
jgi:hypothetical protein